MKKIEQYLEEKLEQGGFRIGQVQVIAGRAENFVFCSEDARFFSCEGREFDRNKLLVLRELGELREVVLRAEGGSFRPLKSAPSLVGGWVFLAEGVAGVRMALETIYPAAVGLWLAWEAGELVPCSWREVLLRQSGMLRRLVGLSDEVATSLFGEVCEKKRGCLREVLWGMGSGEAFGGEKAEALREVERTGEIPLVCFEACNFLLSEATRRCAEGGKEE